jgi:hypothetical protein
MLKEWLPQHLEANDDLTLEEHSEAFEEEFGQSVSTSTIGRAIAGLPEGGWPLKKVTDSLWAWRGGEGVVALAGFPLWRKKASVCGRVGLSHLHDAPLRQSSERQEGLYGKVPRNRGKNTTLIAAITLEGAMGTSMTSRGSYRRGGLRLVQARGADLVFLPSYSPEMNPIEESFSKVKALVRKEGARVREVLVVRP